MNYKPIQELVNKIYNEYNVTMPSKDIYKILDDIGITIYEKQFLNSYEDDCIIDNRIFLVSNPKNVVRLSVLLGHFLLQLPEDNIFETSIRCNAFAVMFLVPNVGDTDIDKISKKYNVPIEIVEWRKEISS